MDLFFLRFLNQQMELNYQNDTKIIQFFLFYRILLIQSFLSMIFMIVKLIEQITIIRIAIFLFILSISILVAILGQKYPSHKNTNRLFLIIHVSAAITFVEIIKYNFGHLSNNSHYYLVYSTPIFIIFNTVILIKLHWYIQSFLNLFFHIYFIIRIFSIENINENPNIIILNIACIVGFSHMTYSQEKNLRKLYARVVESNSLINDYAALLKNIIPSPILLINVDKKEIFFENNSAIDFFNNFEKFENDNPLKRFDKLCNILSYFSVSGEELRSGANLLNELLSNFDNNFDLDNIFLNSNNEFLSLSQLPIYNLNKENIEKLSFYQKQLIYNNEKNHLFLNFNEEISLKKKEYYNFKVLKLKWLNRKCLLLIIDDISHIYKLEELKNLDHYKDQLLATVSHDLRTPLNGMLGMLESSINTIISKKEKKHLLIAKRSGQLLLSMINDFLDFSQINNKKLRLTLSKVNIINIIKQTYKLVKFQVKLKGLEFIFVIDSTIDNPLINSDGNRIQQILLNLLNNAIKFTQIGYIKLSLEKLKNVYKIIVEDSGIGISDIDKPKLFKLFGKLEDNKGLNQTGVGLGLTISKNLALLLNEYDQNGIYLDSEYGKGSKFWFNLPINDEFFLNERDEVNKPYFFEFNKFIEDSLKNKIYLKVLLVDDDMINILVASEYCRFFSVEFLIANNGEAAVNIIEEEIIIKNNKIDGIFMDINMPILNGYQASMIIKKKLIESKNKIIPIVAMTANIIGKNNKNFIDSGMIDFIVKPVSRNTFGETLKKYMQ